MSAIDGGFNRWSQHFILMMRWGVNDEAAPTDMLLGYPAGGDLGSMAARGVDECDWSRLCAGVVVDLFGVVAVGRDPSGGSQAIAMRA